MPPSHRRTARLTVALAVALVAAVVGIAGARDSGSASPLAAQHHHSPHPEFAGPPLHRAQVTDDGPRNPAAEAATGDTQAMLAVVQDVVDCLRANGFHPGDPQLQGENVVITDWDPAWDSPAGRADQECAFPAR